MRRLKTLCRTLLEAVGDNALQRRTQLAVQGQKIRRVFLQSRADRVDRGFPLEWALFREHLIKHDAE